MEYPKKLIEVALPLDDINAEAAREKSIRHGHPSTLHLWWARRPLAAARAVLFAQLVNDPGGKRGYGAYKGQTKEDAQKEREKLFQIIRDLVKWGNYNNKEVLEKARTEICRSWEESCKITGDDPSQMPPFLDPFAGGGSIPLEAQRLGLETYASDLNPVPVLINKALMDIPQRFINHKPIGPVPHGVKQNKLDNEGPFGGFAEDVRRYGIFLRTEAEKRVGNFYPHIELPKDMGGGTTNVLAWLWARTVKCANPVCGCQMPLITTFVLSTKTGRETWLDPVINRNTNPPSFEFKIKAGKGKPASPPKTGRGANFKCLACGQVVSKDHLRNEFIKKNIGTKLLAIVVQAKGRRIYLPATRDQEDIAGKAVPPWKPEEEMNQDTSDLVSGRGYGITQWYELFTNRQLLTLTTLSDLISSIKERVISDANNTGWVDDGIGLNNGGVGLNAYAEGIMVYLSLALSKMADAQSSFVRWKPSMDQAIGTFGRQAIPMVWDFAESNPFAGMAGDFVVSLKNMMKVIERLECNKTATINQHDASMHNNYISNAIVSTDPPYYDNISYADLSDYFYIWLRRSLKHVFPDIFSTMLVPKSEELIAASYRHGGKKQAETFFMEGMKKAITNIANNCHNAYPVTIYYAFKQSESADGKTVSTGWETFLEAVLKSGFSITATWPMRTEMGNRMVGMGSNALASSIVLACRKRPKDVQTISRKQFLREIDESLPEALEDMIGGKEGASPVAPVDLAQAAIGPGMAIFSKYSAVLEADGSSMSVHNALVLINKAIDEYFTHAESDMDADTRFCVDWFQQYGFKAGQFGEADVLARAKGTSVDGVDEAGVIEAGGGKVRLLTVKEYPTNWDPAKDKRIPVWEACHHICRIIQESESAAGELLSNFPEKAEPIRQLAYRLYTICERKGWAQEAGFYNNLITSWHAIVEESRKVSKASVQTSFV